MENATTAIKIGAAIVIVLVVVSIGFMVLRSGQDTAKLGLEKLGQINSDLDTLDMSMYDNESTTGNEVVNFIEKNKSGSFSIIVYTGMDTDGEAYVRTYNSSENTVGESVISNMDELIKSAKDPGKSVYINPSKSFLGKVIKNKNGVVTCVEFRQQ